MTILTVFFWLIVSIVVGLALGRVFRQGLIRISSQKTAMFLRTAPLTASFGMLVITIYILCAIFAPLIAPYGEAEILSTAFNPWTSTYYLGTDNLGRDVFSRLIYGARNTVGIALLITTIAFVLGTSIGILSALKGGYVDQILGRFVDVLMAIPSLIFSLLMPVSYTHLRAHET